MDINKLANTAMDNKYGCIVSSRLEELEKKVFLEAYREGALAGYKHATTWYSMHTAEKVYPILISMPDGDDFIVREAIWDDNKNGFVCASGYVIHTPIAWTHLPVYNQENQ